MDIRRMKNMRMDKMRMDKTRVDKTMDKTTMDKTTMDMTKLNRMDKTMDMTKLDRTTMDKRTMDITRMKNMRMDKQRMYKMRMDKMRMDGTTINMRQVQWKYMGKITWTVVRSLTVMWDGTMVVAANNRGTCYVWRLLRGKQTMTEFEPLHKLQAHNGHILKCLLSPANNDCTSDKTVKIWNVDGFKLEKVLTGHQRWVWDCIFSVDGEFLVTASSDMTARLWSMPAGK